MKIFSNKINCNCCSNKMFEEIFEIKNMPIKTANNSKFKDIKNNQGLSLTFLFCKKCTNMQLKEIVNPKILYNNFSYETNSSFGLVKHFKSLGEKIHKEYNIKQNELIVDIGSNDGSFLKYFKKKGINVLGIEPSKKISDLANKKGIKTLSEYFDLKTANKIEKEYGYPRIISCFNTFANISDISGFLIGIKKIMNEKTVGIIETQYGLDVVRKNLIDTVYHEHINYFTKKSLNTLLKKNNLEIFRFKEFGNKGGSLRVFFKLNKNHVNKKKLNLKDLYNETKKINIGEVRKFKKKINKAKLNLKEYILKNKITKLSGFGASVGTSTLIKFFELENLIDVIYDDNQIVSFLKFDKKKIAVLKSDKMYHKNVNKILILFAYRYFKNIKKKHSIFIRKFGNFLIPLPSFRLNK